MPWKTTNDHRKLLRPVGFQTFTSEVRRLALLSNQLVSRLAFCQLQSDVMRDALPTCLNRAGVNCLFNTIAQAVGERAGMQLVLSIGPVLDPQQIKSLPASAIVVNHAPQIELLKRSALCITHAGLNTTLEAFTQGVPLVAIPVTNDQPGVAARIAYTKTGASVSLKS